MNALKDERVARELNDNFVCSYMKVGKFQIINEQKVGGNVASYFCLPDGSVVHAVAGTVNADKLLTETRWAIDTRKAAKAKAVNLETGKLNREKYLIQFRMAHGERYHAAIHNHFGNKTSIPKAMPVFASNEAKTHWLLADQPLAKLDRISPVVWRQILREELSALPVDKR